jgi:lipid-binding SYLF domain-containing protein
MKRTSAISLFAASIVACSPLLAGNASEETNHRLHEAASVFSEVTAAPDKGIPSDLIERAKCVVIVPGLKKGAFVIGAKYGKGFISCRGPADAKWSAPGAIKVEGGSFGFQIGGSETDVVMLVMNDNGAKKLLESKFTLGGEGQVAAGPVGRTASADTDAKLTAEILSWSRSRGVFAGISLQGATLREDSEDNEAMYGQKISNRDIVTKGHETTPAAAELITMLNKYSPMKEK